MLDIDNEMYALHFDKAKLLVHLKKYKEAEKTIKEAKKISDRIEIELDKIYDANSINDISDLEYINLYYPEF